MVIVDDHSTDETITVINELQKDEKRINCYQRPNTYVKGANACRNYGIEKSNGQFLVFFDSDDIMHPDYLKDLLSTIHNEKDYEVAACKGIYFNIIEGETVYKNEVDYQNLSFPEDFISRKAPFGTPNFIIKSDILDKIDHWDESLFKAQDYDFFGRILLHYPCKFINKTLYYARGHNNNITSSFFSNKNAKLTLSDYKSRKKIYHLAVSKGAVSNDFIDFVVAKQLTNFFHLLKMKKVFSAGEIFFHIIGIKTSPNKNKLIIDFFKKKLSNKFS